MLMWMRERERESETERKKNKWKLKTFCDMKKTTFISELKAHKLLARKTILVRRALKKHKQN